MTIASSLLLALTSGALAYLIARYVAVWRSAPVVADQWRAALFQRSRGTVLALIIALATAAVAYMIGEAGDAALAHRSSQSTLVDALTPAQQQQQRGVILGTIAAPGAIANAGATLRCVVQQ